MTERGSRVLDIEVYAGLSVLRKKMGNKKFEFRTYSDDSIKIVNLSIITQQKGIIVFSIGSTLV